MSQKNYDAYQIRLKKFEANRKNDIDAALRETCATHKGRTLLWWLLETAGVGTIPFSPDPYRTAFNCGELNVGQQVLARLTEVNPTGYLLMMKENADDRTALEREPEPGTNGGDANAGEYDSPGSNDPAD